MQRKNHSKKWLVAYLRISHFVGGGVLQVIENSMTEEQINAIGYEYALHPENFEKESEMEIKCEQVGNLTGGKWDKMHDIAKRVYGTDGLAPTMHTCGGGNLEPKIAELLALDEQNKYIRQDGTCGTLTTYGSSPKHNNRVIEPNLKKKMCNELLQQGKVQENDVIRHSYTNSRMNGEMKDIQQNNMSPTIDTRADCLGVCTNYRIRKLTPKECFRLQGVKDKGIDKIMANQSNSSGYHLAGDSICATVLVGIFAQMFGLDSETEIRKTVNQIKGDI